MSRIFSLLVSPYILVRPFSWSPVHVRPFSWPCCVLILMCVPSPSLVLSLYPCASLPLVLPVVSLYSCASLLPVLLSPYTHVRPFSCPSPYFAGRRGTVTLPLPTPLAALHWVHRDSEKGVISPPTSERVPMLATPLTLLLSARCNRSVEQGVLVTMQCAG